MSVVMVLAAGFVFLTPGETGEAVKGDAQALFEKNAATAKAVVATRRPDPLTVNRWHLVGGKVYLSVPVDAEMTPDWYRRLCGFGAIDAGVDGVVTEASGAYAEALALAKDDVKAVEKLDGLIGEMDARGKTASVQQQVGAAGFKSLAHDYAVEARRARHWRTRLPVFGEAMCQESVQSYRAQRAEPADLIRLETLALCRRLEMLLGRKPSDEPMAAYRARHGAAPAKGLGVVPKNAAKCTMVPRKPVAVGKNTSVSYDFGNITFSFRGEEKLEKDGYPGGLVKLRLWLPTVGGDGQQAYNSKMGAGESKGGDGQQAYNSKMGAGESKMGWTPYRVTVNLAPFGSEKTAPAPAGWLYRREPRFPGEHRVWPPEARIEREVLALDTPATPDVFRRCHWELKRDKTAGWTLDLRVPWINFYGQWPAVEDGMKTTWYVEMTDRAGESAAGRLEWLKGADRNYDQFGAATHWRDFTNDWLRRKRNMWWMWYSAIREKHYVFMKTSGYDFSRLAEESDEFFHAAYHDPRLADLAKLEELTYESTDKERRQVTNAQIKSAVPALCHQAYGEMGRMITFDWDVLQDRLVYLMDRYEGKTPTPRKQVAPKQKSNKEIAPTLDDDGGMALDEETL